MATDKDAPVAGWNSEFDPRACTLLADAYEIGGGFQEEANCIRLGMAINHDSHVALRALQVALAAPSSPVVGREELVVIIDGAYLGWLRARANQYEGVADVPTEHVADAILTRLHPAAVSPDGQAFLDGWNAAQTGYGQQDGGMQKALAAWLGGWRPGTDSDG